MNTTEKLQALRKEMRKRNIAAYIVPTDDFHSSEYVGDYFKTREYMSGFTGSAGTLLVMPDRAFLWTDGRYFLQAEDQLSGSGIELMKSREPDVPILAEFLGKELAEGNIIGFDGRTVTGAFVKELEEKVAGKQITYRADKDLVGLVWPERPPMLAEQVWEVEVSYAGLSREEKLKKVREEMEKAGADAYLVTALDETAWLLNLRGGDVKNTPVFLAYMLITKRRAILCAQGIAFSEEIGSALKKAGVTFLPYDNIEDLVASLPAGQKLLVDERKVNYCLLQAVSKGVERVNRPSPIELLKAVKTKQETDHIKNAHIKDGVALTRFIYWLKSQVGQEKITEMTAAEKLEEFRAMQEGYLGPSFDPIMAYGAHAAIPHYAATPETDAKIQPKGFCLMDTGGHYSEGTTDVTRTVVMGELTAEEKSSYTLVLKGHLRLGAARFMKGVCGQNLDVLARTPLWEHGLDYNHGTGHGVGYLLGVHEGPQNFRWRIEKDTACVPLESGMVISNEPGLYVAGHFGIRHENLVLVQEGEKNDYGQFMYLEPLTMVPFDREAIDVSLMSAEEIVLLNDYHQKVFDALSPYFEGEELLWLNEVTAAI